MSQVSQFNDLFLNPKESSLSLKDLQEWSELFPYCQSLYYFQAQIAQKSDHFLANQMEKKAFIFSTAKDKLYNFLKASMPYIKPQVETLNEKLVEKPILRITNEVTQTISQNLSSDIYQEIQDQLQKLRELKIKSLESNKIAEEPIEKEITNYIETNNDENLSETKLVKKDIPSQIETPVLEGIIKKNQEYSIHKNANTSVFFETEETESDGLPQSDLMLLHYLEFLKNKTAKLHPQIEEKSEQNALIDQFLGNIPKLKKPNIEAEIEEVKKDFSAHSTVFSQELLSENLAQIFVKQKKYTKAIEMYKKLSLKFPEKSAYFADKIILLEKN